MAIENGNGETIGMTHQILLNKEQLEVVKKACELLCRLHLGQVQEVADLYVTHPSTLKDASEMTARYFSIKYALTELSSVVTGIENPHASFGIGNPKVHPDHAIAYEIWRVIENYLQPHEFMREPLKLTSHPMPVVKIASEDSSPTEE